MVVACAADSNYALPLAVTLSSMAAHLGPGIEVDVYVLNDGVSAGNQAKIAAPLPAGVRLHWRQPPCAVAGLPNWGRMSSTTYHKLTLADWLPEHVTRAIWLDCDLLVLQDISRLWQVAPGQPGTLAVQDRRVPLVSSRFGVAAWRELELSPEARYFNAGVLLLDLLQWRRLEIGRRAMEYLRKHGDRVYFWDQEALNAVMAGSWEQLDRRWNWHPDLDRLVGRRSGLPSPDPWIVHFSGGLKPWTFAGTGRYRTLYTEYLGRTAWAGYRPASRAQDRLAEWYTTSFLRRLLYPIEQWTTVARRTLTWKFQKGRLP